MNAFPRRAWERGKARSVVSGMERSGFPETTNNAFGGKNSKNKARSVVSGMERSGFPETTNNIFFLTISDGGLNEAI